MTSVFSQSLQLYYSRLALEHFAARETALDALKTKEDALAYIESVQEKTAKAFSLPQKKTAVPDAQIIGKLPFAWGNIEKIVYQVPENGPVSANLYLPFPNGKKFPAALVLCGHSDIGKACPAYQMLAMLLAKTGFAVMVIDPIGQGDRRQFGPDFKGYCWDEHCYIGRRLFPLGDWTGARMAQDAVSAIDYLSSRPEIDISTLGVTGNSGGGTATTFLTSIEKRITITAPMCYVTSWENNICNERPTDNEQIPPHALAQNLDIVDFLIARAPVPVLIGGKKNDFFDSRGTEKAFAELKKIYSLLGKADSAELLIDDGNHGLSFALRAKCCEFFARHAGLPVPEITADPEPFSQEELSCGKLETTLSPHICRALEMCPEKNGDLAEELHLALPVPIPKYYVLREIHMGETYFSRFGLPENDLVMSVLYKKDACTWYHLPEKEEKVTLYVAGTDAKDELLSYPNGIWGIDLCGVGEMTPTSCYQGELAEMFTLNGNDYHYSALGLQLDRPMLGLKVQDLLKAVSLLATFTKQISIIACGNACVPAMLAKRLDSRITDIELREPPQSWRESVLEEMPNLPQSAMLFVAIGKFDWKE